MMTGDLFGLYLMRNCFGNSMIKELFILIKMLFGKEPKDIEGVTLMGMNHFPFRGYAYIMWCGKMIYRNDMYDRRQKEWPTDAHRISKNHELIHLAQAKRCGSWAKYYWAYFKEWLKGNPIINPASSAYLTIPFEVEAYANEEDPEYWKHYDGNNLPKYTLSNRKKLYREIGRENWINYIKNL